MGGNQVEDSLKHFGRSATDCSFPPNFLRLGSDFFLVQRTVRNIQRIIEAGS